LCAELPAPMVQHTESGRCRVTNALVVAVLEKTSQRGDDGGIADLPERKRSVALDARIRIAKRLGEPFNRTRIG
jgi:hypothetical protein